MIRSIAGVLFLLLTISARAETVTPTGPITSGLITDQSGNTFTPAYTATPTCVNDITKDTIAVQAAITKAKGSNLNSGMVKLPSSGCTVDYIDLTTIAANGSGNTPRRFFIDLNGGVLICNGGPASTDGPCLDRSNSQGVQVMNGTIFGGSNCPFEALQEARPSDNTPAARNSLVNVTFDGCFTRMTDYNFASENYHVENVIYRNTNGGAAFTVAVSGTTATVTNWTGQLIEPNQEIHATGILAHTTITTQVTGTEGQNGTYTVTKSQSLTARDAATEGAFSYGADSDDHWNAKSKFTSITATVDKANSMNEQGFVSTQFRNTNSNGSPVIWAGNPRRLVCDPGCYTSSGPRGSKFTGSQSGTVLTRGARTQGVLLVGDGITGSGVTGEIVLTDNGDGTYGMDTSQTFGSRTLNGAAPNAAGGVIAAIVYYHNDTATRNGSTTNAQPEQNHWNIHSESSNQCEFLLEGPSTALVFDHFEYKNHEDQSTVATFCTDTSQGITNVLFSDPNFRIDGYKNTGIETFDTTVPYSCGHATGGVANTQAWNTISGHNEQYCAGDVMHYDSFDAGRVTGTPTLANAGSGCTLNEVITMASPGTATGFKIKVLTLGASNSVATFSVNSTGKYPVPVPVDPIAQSSTTGTCTGVTMNVQSAGAWSYPQGARNLFLGPYAGDALTTGSGLVAIGDQAGAAMQSTTNSVAIGQNALGSVTTGNGLVGIGSGAMSALTSGTRDIAIGQLTGNQLTSGSDDLLIGRGVASDATNGLTSGSRDIVIGTASSCWASTISINDEFDLCASTGSTPLLRGNLASGSLALTINGPTTILNSVTLGAVSSATGSAVFANSGSANTLTLQSASIATASRTVTFPDPGASDSVAYLALAQAFTNKTYNGNTWTAGTGTLTLGAGKTFTVNNSITFSGTDATTMTLPTTSQSLAPLANPIFTGTVTGPTIKGGTTASLAMVIESTSGVGTSDSIAFKTGSQVTALTIDTSQNSIFAGTIAGGTTAGASLNIESTTGAGTTDKIQFKTGSQVNAMQIDTSGDVIIQGPGVIGGTAASSALTLESTTGVGTSDKINFKTGSQATNMCLNTNGVLAIGGNCAVNTGPGLKKSSTTLQVRLADDSADAPVSMSNLTASGATITLSNTAFTTSGCTSLAVTITSGVITCTASDERVKNDMGVISPDVGLKLALTSPDLHEFTFKPGYGAGGPHMGWFAQDVQLTHPDWVRRGEAKELTPDGELFFDKNDQYGPIAIAAIKGLQTEIDSLNSIVAGLKATNDNLLRQQQ